MIDNHPDKMSMIVENPGNGYSNFRPKKSETYEYFVQDSHESLFTTNRDSDKKIELLFSKIDKLRNDLEVEKSSRVL